MTSFFISPFKPPEEWYGESELKLDVNSFAEGLRLKWPNISITLTPGSKYNIVEWEVLKGDGTYGVRGSLEANQQIVSLDGTTADLAEFVLWYRKLIPSQYRLFFFHESLYTCLEIKQDTTLDEIGHAIERGTR